MSPIPRFGSDAAGSVSHSLHAYSRHVSRAIKSVTTSASKIDSSISQRLARGIASWPRVKRDLNTKQTIGFSMIPVGMLLALVLVGFLMWRRRKQRLSYLQDSWPQQTFPQEDKPPPVPAKDYPPRLKPVLGMTERGRDKRSSRVFNMAAFTTPIHGDDKRERSVIGQSPEKRSALQSPQRKTEAKAVRLVVPEESEVDHESLRDSPVDGGSPFRLKPDNGIKRLSLGTEISKAWPSPPPSIWIGTPQGGITPPQPSRTRIVPSRQLTDTEAEIIGLYSRSWYIPADYETSR